MREVFGMHRLETDTADESAFSLDHFRRFNGIRQSTRENVDLLRIAFLRSLGSVALDGASDTLPRATCFAVTFSDLPLLS